MPPHDSIGELAADYAAAIRAVQPNGPLHLAGWSSGGTFAYAVAEKLRAAGDEIGLLALVDAPLPSFVADRDLADDARFLCDYVEFCNHVLGSKMELSYEALKQLSPDEAFEAALAEARKHKMAPPDAATEFIKTFVEVGRSTARLLQQYKPAAIDVPVELIVPQDTAGIIQMSGKSFVADRGWQTEIGCRVTIRQIAGDHFSMLTGDNAADLAETLRELLPAKPAGEAGPIGPPSEPISGVEPISGSATDAAAS
jgi:myxalamid-type polyketide synthase MxaB